MTVSYDIMTHAKNLVEGASVARGISSGRYEISTIDGSMSALAAAGAPYPVIIEPDTVAWMWPEDYTTTAVDQRWDRVAFTIDIYVTPHTLDPMETNEEVADIAYEIRRTISDPSSWISSVSGFVAVNLDDCTVETVDTNFEGSGDQVDFIYVIRQPVTVTYREDHS